jgi:hypothetical protein
MKFLTDNKIYILLCFVVLAIVLSYKKSIAMSENKNKTMVPGGTLNFNSDINKKDAPLLNKNLVSDLKLAADTLGYSLTVTTTKADHTHLGEKSRHYKFQAVDISIINGYSFKSNKEKFTEYGHKTCNFLESIGYTRNKENGNNKAVLWFFNNKTAGNHFNHLHISNRS